MVLSSHLANVNGPLARRIHILGFMCVPDSVDKPYLVTPGLPGVPAPTVPALAPPWDGGWGRGALCDLSEDQSPCSDLRLFKGQAPWPTDVSLVTRPL